jgi:hypothetical protein
VVFRVARVLALESRNLRFLLIVSDSVDSFEVEVAQEVTQLFPKFAAICGVIREIRRWEVEV